MYIHLYTGNDGESHFEEMAFPFPEAQATGPGEVNAAESFTTVFPQDTTWGGIMRRGAST